MTPIFRLRRLGAAVAASKVDVVQGLLEGRRVGRYMFYIGLRVRSRTDTQLWGDHIEYGTIRGFHKEMSNLAMVELVEKGPFKLGVTHNRYRFCAMQNLIPVDY